MSAPDIRRPAEVDAAWLTAVLQGAGVDAVVGSFSAANVGSGQIGESVRFKLAYERGGKTAPASIVGKFPSPDPDSFRTGVMLGNYVREVNFYRDLADSALISTPTCYLSTADEATGEFVLMMEDLAPAEQGDQLQGVSLERARLAVVEAARLHASHWADPAIDDLPWISGTRAAPASAVTPELVQGLWAGFRERYAERLLPHWIEVGEALVGRGNPEPPSGPRCLVHHDYRPDNMMFATAGGGRAFTMLDWQSVSLGVGPTDVAYFLAGALPRDVRRAHEPEMLTLYHRTLTGLGVSGYSEADLARDYARGGYQLFLTAFFASMIVVRTARGDDMFMQMLGSAADHIIDHAALA